MDGSKSGVNDDDLDLPNNVVIYQRRIRTIKPLNNNNNNKLPWNRSLYTRGGRTSVSVVQKQPPHTKPKVKVAQPPNFDKEREYFREVDAFELLEESPSPIKPPIRNPKDYFPPLPKVSSRLEAFLGCSSLSKILETPAMHAQHYGDSTTLTKILETPPIHAQDYGASTSKALEATMQSNLLGSRQLPISLSDDERSVSRCKTLEATKRHNLLGSKQMPISLSDDEHDDRGNASKQLQIALSGDEHDDIGDASKKLPITLGHDEHEDIGDAIRRLSLGSSTSSSDHDYEDKFTEILKVCEQQAPSSLIDVFSEFCNPKDITKVGEGTFGEAFKAGNCVCKIVPIDGNLKVNGEDQKKSEELLGEVILCRTLNLLRGCEDGLNNACTTFIETLALLFIDSSKVCQGRYDDFLIKAWEDWGEKHDSENDHPNQFPDDQNYVVFVLQHGGKDLESFDLLNFDEARSLLVQVTFALAVAESAFQFEHRDLHWGNILLNRNDTASLKFVLDGKPIIIKAFGLSVSIIDFTLSRINAGKDILFFDLATDPDIFKGPKGDKQSETYRKMKTLSPNKCVVADIRG
ncbi:hypothetical protein ACFE04_027742 [Oxalis oulophora]